MDAEPKLNPINVTGTLPTGTRRPIGFLAAGIDPPGTGMFFGFKLPGGATIRFNVSHTDLGAIIQYLQAIATTARQRRIATGTTVPDQERIGRIPHPATALDLVPDLSGKTALLQSTQADGTSAEIQLPLDILEGLAEGLPSTLAEMKNRRGQRRH